VTPGTFAQRYGRFPETVEPPLADEAGTVQTAAAREPRTLAPGVRFAEAPAPLVLLTVRAPAALPVGQEVEVRLVAENVGRLPARNVAVIYAPPPGNPEMKAAPEPKGKYPTGELVWQFETLAAGGRQEIVLTVKLPADAQELDTRAKVVFEQEQSVKTRFAKPDLKVRKTGPTQAQCYDILVFGMEVTNGGSVDLTDVTLTDPLPAGLEHRPDEVKDRPYKGGAGGPTVLDAQDRQTRVWRIGRLAPGQTQRVEYYVAAPAKQAGPIDHKAVAQAAGGVRTEAAAKVTLVEPKLELKAEAPARRSAHLPAGVRITLANRGQRMLTNIVVADEVLDPCKLEGISAGGQQFGNRVQWVVPALAPNESRVLELQVRRPDGGKVRHQVTAAYRELPPQQAVAQTEFDATAALAWDFRGTPATVEVNGEVLYTMTVRNTGASPAANVRPVVDLPPELEAVQVEPAKHQRDGRRVAFAAVTLPPNARATYLVRAKAVRASVAAKVQAELSADVYGSEPVRRQEVTAIGGSAPAPPPALPSAPPPSPIPVPPPPQP
jgi:uncharacterized repeat protein (TIGR01451 family)